MEEDGETEGGTEKDRTEKEGTENEATVDRTEDEARAARMERPDDWDSLEEKIADSAAPRENGMGQRTDERHEASFQSRSVHQAPPDLQCYKRLECSTAVGLGLLLAEESQVGFSVGSTESSGISSPRAHWAFRPVSANRPGSARRKKDQARKAAKDRMRETSALE
jgi:hypothetical protein